MKKSGFTLAEVLIALGIIGVIAAMTLPALQTDIVQRQIGPKLAKAVSNFEQASEALLNERMSDSLFDAEIITNNGTGNNYASQLTEFMKATNSGATLTSKDGMYYAITIGGVSSFRQPHNNRVGNVMIDIDGNGRGADANGEDRFWFSLYDDGSLRPYGSANYMGSQGTGTAASANLWAGHCDRNNHSDMTVCAGYIFENNLKADYQID